MSLPYVNRVDAQGGDGIRMVQELQTLLNITLPTAWCWRPVLKRRGRRWIAYWQVAVRLPLPLDVKQQNASIRLR